MNNGLLEVIGEDKYAISYRPKFTALTDSALAAILLQEMIYFWKNKDGEPFYKFKEPCNHDKYKDGDSWCETLGFNKHEFDSALKIIGTKIKKGMSKSDVLATEYPERNEGETDQAYYDRFTSALKACVIYWTDRGRVTWYQVNEQLLGKFVGRIYISNVNGARYLKKSILEFRNKKSWDERRKDSTKVSAKVPSNDSKDSPENADANSGGKVVKFPEAKQVKPKPKTKHEKRLASDPLYAAAASVWQTDADGWLNNAVSMLRGKSKTGEWQNSNFDPERTPTPDQLLEWGNDCGKYLPRIPDKVQSSLYAFMAKDLPPPSSAPPSPNGVAPRKTTRPEDVVVPERLRRNLPVAAGGET